MRHPFLLLTLLMLVGLVSCNKDDEPVPPHQIGSWELANYSTINLPTEFASLEDQTHELNEITLGSAILESYLLVIHEDGTYERALTVVGSTSPFEDTGEWTLDGTDMIMDGETVDFRWRIERNESDQLWLSQASSFFLMADAIQDTLTMEYVETLTSQEYSALFSRVGLDLVYAFDRQ